MSAQQESMSTHPGADELPFLMQGVDDRKRPAFPQGTGAHGLEDLYLDQNGSAYRGFCSTTRERIEALNRSIRFSAVRQHLLQFSLIALVGCVGYGFGMLWVVSIPVVIFVMRANGSRYRSRLSDPYFYWLPDWFAGLMLWDRELRKQVELQLEKEEILDGLEEVRI